MKINKYPDGSSYISSTGLESTVFTFKVNSYEDLWHLNQIVEMNNHYDVTPVITIPNLIDAQADRRFNDYESSGLKSVCKFLGNMKARFKIFHPHNPEVVEALMDNVSIIDNTEFIQRVLGKLAPEGEDSYNTVTGKHINETVFQNTILMSADAGGFKPLIKLCDNIDWQGGTYSASKARSPVTKRMVQLIDKDDFEGKDILIVDDISIYGGTFKGLSKLLRDRNCGKLYLAVSHMTVQNLGEDPVTNYFDKVFTTNSKYDHYYLDSKDSPMKSFPDNLEIIKMFNYECTRNRL